MGTGWTYTPNTVEVLLETIELAINMYKDEPSKWADVV